MRARKILRANISSLCLDIPKKLAVLLSLSSMLICAYYAKSSYFLINQISSACTSRILTMNEFKFNDLMCSDEDALIGLLHRDDTSSEHAIILHVFRTQCSALSGSLTVLMHPRVYAVVTNKPCFGDVPHLTAYSANWIQYRPAYLVNLVQRHVNVFFPRQPKAWNGWRLMYKAIKKSLASKEIILPLTEHVSMAVKPTFWPKTWSTSQMPSCNEVKIPNGSSCSLDVRPTSLPFDVALRDLIKQGYESNEGISFGDLSRNEYHCKINLMEEDSRQHKEDELNQSLSIPVFISSSDRERHGSPSGAIYVSTWVSSKSCQKDIPLYLKPLKWFPVLDEKPNKKKYLASFTGTATRGFHDGKGGLVRYLLGFLESRKDRIAIYTKCHVVHKDQECTTFRDEERLYFVKHRPFVSFEESLQNSTFCLCPKGRQPASYRWMEALRSGCIPVYISDPGDDFIWQIFLNRQIPWNKIMIYHHGFLLQHLPFVLKNINPEQIDDMHQALQRLRRRFLENDTVLAQMFLDDLAASLI